MFALINLNIQRRFTSGHALALYENCYRFVRTGSTGWWPIDLFRRLMGVEDSTYYETYKHLNAKIIKPSVAEVNRTSNISITPEVRKAGRAVTHLRFAIRENPQLAMFEIDDGEGVRQSPVYLRLLALGVGDRLARGWIAEHGAAVVAEKLAYVAAQDGVASPVRYLTAALRDDYAAARVAPPAQPAPELVAAAAERAGAAAEVAQVQAARDAVVSAERRDRAARMARVRAVAEARNPTQRDADRRLFLAGLSDGLAREEFARLGWASGLSARAIFAFWAEMEPGIFDGV